MDDRQQPYEGYQPPAYTGYTGHDAPSGQVPTGAAPGYEQTPADPYASTSGSSFGGAYPSGAAYPSAAPYAPAGYGPPTYPTEPPGRTLGIVGFVLAFVMPLAGIVVSAMSLSASRKAQVPNPLGTWGLWLSIIFTVVGGLIFLAYIGLMVMSAGLAMSAY